MGDASLQFSSVLGSTELQDRASCTQTAHLNLDANATFGVSPSVQSACAELLGKLARRDLLNPSSVHQPAQRARALLDDAREAIRVLVGAREEDVVVFTSGATESNNQALISPFLTQRAGTGIPSRLLVSNVEHESVHEAAARVAALGYEVNTFAADVSRSIPTVADFKRALHPHTKVISSIHGQNETGAILPVKEFVSVARQDLPQVFFHTDAVQTVGRIPVSMHELGVDALSLSGHKFGALTGVGALVVRSESKAQLESFIVGGPQQSRYRAGTENLLGIYSLGIAAREAYTSLAAKVARMCSRRELLRCALREQAPGVLFVDEQLKLAESQRLPNTLLIILPRNRVLRGDDLVLTLDLAGIATSTGSACGSGKQEGNTTLKALKFDASEVMRALRLSVTGEETDRDILRVVQHIAQFCARSPEQLTVREEAA